MAAIELYTSTLFDDSNLKAYYRFEETSGTTVNDSSLGAHNGTASRTNILNNASGKFGYKAVFASASSDKITLSDHADFKPTGNFSFGCWLLTSASALQGVFQSFSNAGSKEAGIQIYLESTGQVSMESGKNTGTVNGTDFKTITSTGTVNDGNWHFVVLTWDGSKLHCYIDGSEDGSGVTWANAPAYQATNYVRIGCTDNSGTEAGFFNGSIDDAFFYNGKALSLSDVQGLYNGTSLKSTGSLFFAQL